MIAITTMEELPNYCYECPCYNGEYGRCEADKEKRSTIDYRPYWCSLKECDTGSVGIRQTNDSVEFTASGNAQPGYELGIVIGKMAMLDYIWKSCMNRNVMTDSVLDILKTARRKI